MQDSRKLAFITTNDHVPWGGSEVLWSRAALRLADCYELGISARKWWPDPDHIQALAAAGARLFLRRKRLPADWRSRIARRLLSVPTPRVEQPEEKFAVLREFRPDLAILSLGNHNSAGDWMAECRRLGIPYVILVQLVKEAAVPKEGTDFTKNLEEGYRQADRIYCVSEDNLQLLEKQFAHAFPQAEVIFNPYRAPRQLLPFPSVAQGYRLAMVANINYNHKGHDLLFEVLRADKWRSRPLSVHIYGKGPHEHSARQLAQHWALNGQVRFHGFSSDLNTVYRHCHAFLLPSRMEGMSLALLEAMMYERAPIVTDLGDSRRLIRDNESGFLIAAPTARFIDEALERAWTARERWEHIGKNAGSAVRSLLPRDPVGELCEKIKTLA